MKRNFWLLLAVLLGGISLWAGTRGGAEQQPPREPVPAAAVHLRILNGTSEAGLAREIGRRLGAAGHVIASVDNAPRPLAGGSLVVNRRLDDATVEAFAAYLGGLTIVREWDTRCSEDAVLVLGADWRTVVAALEGTE